MKRLLLLAMIASLSLQATFAPAATNCYNPQTIFNPQCLVGLKMPKMTPHHKARGVPSFMKPYRMKMPKMKSWGNRGRGRK